MIVNQVSTIDSFASWVIMFRLVADLSYSNFGTIYWEKHQPNAPCRILTMNVNRVSTDVGVEYLVIKAMRGSSNS
jgi:hypothetical protein